MKKLLLFLYSIIIGINAIQAAPWEAPTLKWSTTSLPTDGTEFVLYNIEKQMFLTKGTRWGTHACLTSDIDNALIYTFNSRQLRCTDGNILFVTEENEANTAHVYYDFNPGRFQTDRTYFNVVSDGTNGLLIKMASDNSMSSTYANSCLGWNYFNEDTDYNHNSLGTNLGLFMLDPDFYGVSVHWGYITNEEKETFQYRKRLYDLLCECYNQGTAPSKYETASNVYNKATSTLEEIKNAYKNLYYQSASYPIDLTSEIYNPRFDYNADGWSVNMPGAQNKGFQSSSYYNGDVSINRFVEAWVPYENGNLGVGSILQTINGLPEGKYTMEVDVIANDQSSMNNPVNGVYAVTESDVQYRTRLATGNGVPERYTITFYNEGAQLTIGLRTEEDCEANWIALDNVRLNYWGPIDCPTTGVSITPSSEQVTEGEQVKLTASVNTSDELFNKVKWSSSDETVAMVNADGLVTTLKPGTVTITAKAVGSSLSSQATITVMKNDVTGLVINEIQVANIDQFIDPSYNYGGWIELYNPTSRSINLSRLYVSDEKTNLKKFQMPAGSNIIEPNGYKNIWFDHNAQDGNFGGESQNNVRFKLNVEGGSIYLSDSEDVLIASATYPASVARCSYARTTDGGSTWGMTSTPTPEASNMGSAFATERLAAPVVSRDGGVFNYGTEVSFNVQIPTGATLRYTTDGSTPTLNHGYTSHDGQFSTYNSTTVFRFALFKDGYLSSPVVTRSFIYKNHDYYLPVISVVTEPANLYDDMIGIYTQGTNGTPGNGKDYACNWNRDWERPVNIEYMRPDANDASSFITHINQETDMEIAGGWSRGFGDGYTDGKKWPMKSSFRIKGSKVYEGQNTLDFAVFPNKPYNKYKVWQVRNGGNDTYSRTMDPVLNRIVLESGFYVDAQDASPAHVFFNGEYLGMLNIRESNNRHYGDSNYGIDTEEMDQFDLSNAQYNQKVGDSKAWEELVALSEQLRYTQSESVWNEICKRLDMDEYINYMAVECFLNCGDWITNTNNVKGFRAKTDGKFHFVLFDTDSAFEVYNDNILRDIIYTSAGVSVAKLFQNIYNYPAFQQQFIDAFCIVNGSVFNPSHFEPIINNWYNDTNPAMGFENLGSSKELINTLKNKHNGNAIWNTASTFGLYSSYNLNISSNIPSARLSLNGQMIPTGQFNGYAFNNRYNGIHLTAKAPAGYRFKGWKQEDYSASGSLLKEYLIEPSATWYYYDQGATADNWTFRRFSTSANGWKQGQAPFGYAANSSLYMQSTANTILDYGTDASNKRPTYYFRKSVTLADDPMPGERYLLHYKVDDGCRIHVNGEDVGGYHCEIGATYDTYSTAYEANDPYEDDIDITEYLNIGPNAIAVEVHNVSSTSSDIYFEAWLVKLTKSENDDIISNHETFCLSDIEGSGTYTLTACYEPIEGEVKRYEAGATPIRINEVSAGNDIHINEYTSKSDWVELYNTTNAPVDVAGMYLSDNAKKPQKWQISKTAADGATQINTIVPAGGHLIVWCDDLAPVSQLHSGFKLSNADGACVSIQAEDGRWADCMQYLEQPRWTTYGRYPDGGNHEQLLEQPTIAKANRIGLFDYNGITEEDFLSDDITVTLAMAEGWNWVSHNMAANVDKSRFTSYADIIRGLSSELFYDDILGWQGLLNNLKPANGYKVRMTQQADITLRGDLFPSLQSVTVQKGWNWIGCPLPNATSLDIALANYAATEGDVIVAQNAMATYTSGTWTGSLNTLQPGQSYMMQAGKAQSFVWKALSGNKVRQRRYVTARHEEATPWNLDIHAYPNVMPMIARVEAHDIDLNNGYTLGVFVDDECRGVAKVEDGLLYINIHGEGGEMLTFQLMDANGDVYTSSQIIEMQNLQLTGSVRNPYRISFNAKDVTPVIASQNGKEVMTNVYYSLNGQRLIQPRGICIQKTIFQDGTTQVKKVVK